MPHELIANRYIEKRNISLQKTLIINFGKCTCEKDEN